MSAQPEPLLLKVPEVHPPGQPGDIDAFKRVVAGILADYAKQQAGVQSSQHPTPAKGPRA